MIKIFSLKFLKQARDILSLALLFSNVSLAQEIQSLKVLNSPYDEKHPVLDVDGTLYFSVGFHPDNVGGFKDFGDIWMARPNPKGGWLKPTRVNALSTEGNDVFIGFLDPITALVYHSEGAFGRGIHQYSKFGQSWNYLRPLEIENFSPIGDYFSARIDDSKEFIILSFEHRSGYGNEDLYISQKVREGYWSSPINLGAEINSFAQEQGPFISQNQEYIFFSSNKGGSGRGKDIYFSKRLDDSWTSWSTPQALVKTSTLGSDLYYLPLLPLQNQAIFSTTQNSEGFGDFVLVSLEMEEEIFMATKPEEKIALQPALLQLANNSNEIIEVGEEIKQETIIESNVIQLEEKYTIMDNDVNESLSTIQVLDLKERFPLNYQITLIGRRGEKLAVSNLQSIDSLLSEATWETLFIQSEGYIPREVGVESWKSLGDYTFYLSKAEAGNSIVLNNIQFNVGTADFSDSRSIQVLDNLAEFLNANPSIKIRFEGHTDNYGDPMLNKELSLKRASKIRGYLTLNGVEFERMRISGWGGTRPIADNSTDEGRNLNRRVEMLIEK